MYADSTRGAARATITVPKLRQMKAEWRAHSRA